MNRPSRMHAMAPTTDAVSRLGVADWFALTPAELARLARALLGEHPRGHWVRQGGQFAVIASAKLGSLAPKLAAELTALTTEAGKILATNSEAAALRAIAFYHLRFANIHPLLEGNGRVGRTILAAQLHQTLRLPVEETLAQLNAHTNDYMMVFPSNNPPVMFELMLDVLARLTGRMLPEEASQLPASILPLYPDRRPLLKNPAQQVRPIRPPAPQRGNPFRKFG